MNVFTRVINFWNDYFSVTRFGRGYRAGMDAGLENGGILCEEALRVRNENWKTELRRIIPSIPITKGLADGSKIRKQLQNLLKK